MSDDEARPAEEQDGPEPGERRWHMRDPLEDAGRRLDHELGKRLPEPSDDPDEDMLDALQAHLRGAGGYSPDGSVWQRPQQGQEPALSPAHHHRLDPPYYDGPGAVRGKHRDGRGRWARFKSWLQDPWGSQ